MYKRNRQGVWLEAGPILFLTCTLRESSYECLKSGGHEKTLYMMLKVVQKGSVESGTYITYFYLSLLPSHSFFKCEMQKSLEAEGNAGTA